MKERKDKLLLLVISVLLITNFALLLFFLQGKKEYTRQDRKTYIANFLEKEIGFSPEQLTVYDTMSDNHRQRIAAIMDKDKTSRPEQFKQLVQGNFSDSVIAVLTEKSAATQKITNAMLFAHIRNIRQLCRPNQLPAFDSLFGKVFGKRGPQGRKKIRNEFVNIVVI